MSAASRVASAERVDLAGRGLLVPGLRAEPLPLHAVDRSPCTAACPAGVNVKAYVSLIGERRFAEAVEVVRERCPLPGVCGRVCTHPCEAACRRQDVDAPVAIRTLKRFVADVEAEHEPAVARTPVRHDGRVAVVGSGPAGLTAAYDLRRAGWAVTVFEAESEPGGMLRYGIADYRLPPAVLEREIDVLVRTGIEVRTGCRLGHDVALDQLLRDGYGAVLVAVGAQRGRGLGFADADGRSEIEDALDFLRRTNAGERSRAGDRVLVVGGGSTAIEAARTALRLGASAVELLYRRSRNEMPASAEEIEVASAEGVRFHTLVAPARAVVEDGRLVGLECQRCALGEPDASGRPRPVPIPGSEHLVAGDRVLAATGQRADLSFLPARQLTRVQDGGRLHADRATGRTRLAGVFAAGDVVTGPASVIDAIAAGHRAARAVGAFLRGGDDARGETSPSSRAEYQIHDPPPPLVPRRRAPYRPLTEGAEWAEVEGGFDVDAAVAEARRCLRCGPCSECRACVPSCSRRHVTVRVEAEAETPPEVPVRVPATLAAALEGRSIPAALVARRGAAWDDASALDGTLVPGRVEIAADRCRACARCVEACPFAAVAVAGAGDAAVARVDAAACRGCGLCAAVCPTGAAAPLVESAAWWTQRLDRALGDASGARELVVACRRRVDALPAALRRRRPVVGVPCVGRIDAGLLLRALLVRGASSVLVAGCSPGRCRYGAGDRLARRHVERARALLAALGADPERITVDWCGWPADPTEPGEVEVEHAGVH